jgi:hypothetical protein
MKWPHLSIASCITPTKKSQLSELNVRYNRSFIKMLRTTNVNSYVIQNNKRDAAFQFSALKTAHLYDIIASGSPRELFSINLVTSEVSLKRDT